MFFRMIFGLPGAAFVTGFLFVAMAWMIRQDAQVGPQIDPPKIEITAKLKPTPPKVTPIPPQSIDPPPPIEIEPSPPSPNPGGNFLVEPVPTPGPGGRSTIFPSAMQPTVRIPPPYPDNCRARGAEGVVIVEFDVTAEGEVVNPRIVTSANACLDRTVLNTIQKWKYQPKQDGNGRPVMQRGVREFFNFQLTE